MKVKGLNLFELMIFLGLVILCFVFVIPSVYKSNIASNEQAAKDKLKELSAALEKYRLAQVIPTFPEEISVLTRPPINFKLPNLYNNKFYTQGYYFVYEAGSRSDADRIDSYDISARPLKQNRTGINSYVINESSMVFVDNGEIADVVDIADILVE